MDEQGYRFGVGVLVVASIVIGVILLLFFGAAPNIFAKRYRVIINFPSAPGVASDTPVRKNGVDIGRVVDVNLRDGSAGVDLILEIDSKYQIRNGELYRIGTASLITGDSVVEVLSPTPESLLARFDGAGGAARNGQLDENEQLVAASYLKDTDYIEGGLVAEDPLNAFLKMQDSLGPTFVAVEKAGTQVAALAQDIRGVIGGGDGQLNQLTKKIEGTLENFNQTLDAIENLFANERLKTAIDSTAEGLPKLLNEAESLFAQAKSTIASFEGVGKEAEAAMKNISEFTEPLGDNGEKIIADAMRTLNNMNLLMADLRQLSSRITNSQGTIARLLDDEQLYFSAVNTFENIQQLSERARPIIEDARAFMDKIARDPGQLGVRGALTGRGPGLGVK